MGYNRLKFDRVEKSGGKVYNFISLHILTASFKF